MFIKMHNCYHIHVLFALAPFRTRTDIDHTHTHSQLTGILIAAWLILLERIKEVNRQHRGFMYSVLVVTCTAVGFHT